MWHGISMADPMVDQMTRLRLKLLEKRLENERDMDGRAESAQSTRSHNGQNDALHNALRRKRNLLQRLKEQHMLEEVTRPHTWGGTRGRYPLHLPLAPQPPLPVAPIHIHQLPPAPPILPLPPPAPPLPPRIIQQTMPQQPTTIIQQLPQQQPLIAQIPPPQPYPAPRSGSIKEDMVEMMLMQNAQMHQIIMQNMMIKALPPMAVSPPGGASHSVPHTPQYGQEKGRGSAVHHHHYGPTAATHPLPPIGYNVWPQMVSTVPGGQGTHVPSIHHVTGPVTLPPLNTTQLSY